MSEPLHRLETGLRAAAANHRRRVVTPAFDLFIAETDDYLLNLAVPNVGPDAEPDDWRSAVRAMTEAFQTRERRPRLEYIHDLHPGLAGALEKAGFKLDMRAPVMTLERSDLAAPPAEVQGEYVRLGTDGDGLKTFLRGQNVAYGGSETDALIFLAGMRAGLSDGSILAAGLEQDGAFVAGAAVQIGNGVGELAGVWTRPDMRRRGLAFRVCQRLLDNFFREGHDLCWLSAAEGAEGVYGRLGFRRAGTQLNFGLPQHRV